MATGSAILAWGATELVGFLALIGGLIIAFLAAIRLLHLDEVIGDLTGSEEIGRTREDEEFDQVAKEFEESAIERGVAKSSKTPSFDKEEKRIKDIDRELAEISSKSTALESALSDLEEMREEKLTHAEIEKKLKERGYNVEDF